MNCIVNSRSLFAVAVAVGALALAAGALSAEDAAVKIAFDDMPAGKPPAGFTFGRTGQGAPGAWVVREGALAQTSTDNTDYRFPVALYEGGAWKDLALSVRFKTVSGEVDRAGGLVFRAKDENNYYIVRSNALEDNTRLYRVVDGRRKQLGGKNHEVSPDGWHTLRVEAAGEKIAVFYDGEKVIEEKDATFPEKGNVGLWTKADAVTLFDDLAVEPRDPGRAEAPAAAPVPAGAATAPGASAPRAAYVVNTQDGSVSLVDLETMKEARRFPVGPRPYGFAVSLDGKTVAVGVEDEESVKLFDARDFALRGAGKSGKMCNDHGILSRDGAHVLVANYHSDSVVGIELAAMREAFRIEGASAPHVIKYGPLRKNAYVTCKKVTGIAIVDPEERKLVKFQPLNVNPRSLTFSPDESKLYFGSFWVDGFFELDVASGKVTRLFKLDPPAERGAPQEVTVHGVEAVGPHVVLAANEGRSYVDAVDVRTGALLDRLAEGVSKPCCIERIPAAEGAAPARVLVSNLGDASLALVEVSPEGKLRFIAKAAVGAAPKRVAFARGS